jgi:hypothetical protein
VSRLEIGWVAVVVVDGHFRGGLHRVSVVSIDGLLIGWLHNRLVIGLPLARRLHRWLVVNWLARLHWWLIGVGLGVRIGVDGLLVRWLHDRLLRTGAVTR